MLRNPADKHAEIAAGRAIESLTRAVDTLPGLTSPSGTQKAGIVNSDGSITSCSIVGITPVTYSPGFQVCKPTA